MTIQELVLVFGMLCTLGPPVAIFLRGGSRYMVIAASLATIAVAGFLGLTLRLVQLGIAASGPDAVWGLMASAVPILLAGYLSATGFGREAPDASFRESRRTFLLLGLGGAVFVALLHRPEFITAYEWGELKGTIFLGWIGKGYLTYLLIGIVVIGYNLEKTFRVAPTDVRHRLRLPILGIFFCLFYLTFVITTGMLYSSLGMGKLVATALPIGFACIVVAYGYVRGSLSDVAAPVSRSLVYSSFTALAAGVFVAAIGAAAQIAAWTSWSPDEVLVLAAGIVTILSAGLFLLSNRFQRRVRRFIDRNFYVNRYDYRTQWHDVSEAFTETTDRASILARTADLLRDVFLADEVTIALSDTGSDSIRPVLGKGTEHSCVLDPASPLGGILASKKKAILIDRKHDDFTFIPVYAENGDWLENTASQIVVPLLGGGKLIGTLGLERRHDDDPFTFEDVALLGSIGAHVSSTLRADQLAQELAETREMELMSQWSSMILHDLKNSLSPLRMAAANLVKHKDKPDTVAQCARDIESVTNRMADRVQTLAKVRLNPREDMEPLCPNTLVAECLDASQVHLRESVEIDAHLNAGSKILGNRGMLRRVLENLVTNAVEAMPDGGRITIETTDAGENGNRQVQIAVADTGVGMPEEFVRERLFRPFATTKPKGLGLGLYQCRSIVQAHGGRLTASSRPGEGTRFEVLLSAESEEAPNGSVNGSPGNRPAWATPTEQGAPGFTPTLQREVGDVPNA